jgi:hypothetical protein
MEKEFKWYSSEELEWVINWIYYKFLTDSNDNSLMVWIIWNGIELDPKTFNNKYRYSNLDEMKEFIKTDLFLKNISKDIKKVEIITVWEWSYKVIDTINLGLIKKMIR